MHGINDAAAQILKDDGAVDPDQIAAATAVDAVTPAKISYRGRRLGYPAMSIGCPEVRMTIGPTACGAGDEAVGADPRYQRRDGVHVINDTIGIKILADNDLLQVTAAGWLNEQFQEPCRRRRIQGCRKLKWAHLALHKMMRRF